ncbi:MAG TPA: nodulation protein NfeD [Desulfomonilia bacterium]
MGRHKKSYGNAWPESAVTFLTIVFILLSAGKILAGDIIVIDVKDAISPPVGSYITENIDRAVREKAEAIIIRLDTPGGLDTSMRDIIQKEMNAPVPVVVYVYPKGARAASAGALICLAADIAAMAPGTNIGAAHPVGIGPGGGGIEKGDKDKKTETDTMTEKVTNDASAYARSIAKERGRNEKWAEDAVRKSVSIPATEAVEKHVVDLIADSLDDLLTKIDGKTIKKAGMTFTLKTKGAPVTERPMNFRSRLLSTLANPNIAYILMLIGLAGIYFELSSPGAILPGILGGICIILAFFAFSALPVNYAGVALIILSGILFFAELKVQSMGLLTVGGFISLILGSIILFRTPEMSAQVSWGVILPIAVFFAVSFSALVWLVLKTHRKNPVTGIAAMTGEKAQVYEWHDDGTGKVFTHGEYWNAKGPAGLKPGETVIIESVRDMELTVKTRE